MRRFTNTLLAVPLALGLMHCATDPVEDADLTDPSADERAAPQILGADARTSSVDAGAVVTDAGASVGDAGAPVASAPFALTSSLVKEGAYIDAKYRCRGPSPDLSWTPGPAGTQSYAILFRDPKNGFFHWTIYDIPATERGLPAAIPKDAAPAVPKGAKQAPNWQGTAGYGGPCADDRPYEFKLYALDVAALPGITARSRAADVAKAIEAHDLASTTLTIRSK